MRAVLEVGGATVQDMRGLVEEGGNARGLCVAVYKMAGRDRGRICAKELENSEILVREEFSDGGGLIVCLPAAQELEGFLSETWLRSGTVVPSTSPAEARERAKVAKLRS